MNNDLKNSQDFIENEDDIDTKWYYDYYSERRKELTIIRSSSEDSFDRAILYLSMAFIFIIVLYAAPSSKLYVSGIGVLMSAIIWQIWSYVFAKKAMEIHINRLDKFYSDDRLAEYPSAKMKSLPSYMTSVSNIISFICFNVGMVIVFMLFVFK